MVGYQIAVAKKRGCSFVFSYITWRWNLVNECLSAMHFSLSRTHYLHDIVCMICILKSGNVHCFKVELQEFLLGFFFYFFLHNGLILSFSIKIKSIENSSFMKAHNWEKGHGIPRRPMQLSSFHTCSPGYSTWFWTMQSGQNCLLISYWLTGNLSFHFLNANYVWLKSRTALFIFA